MENPGTVAPWVHQNGPIAGRNPAGAKGQVLPGFTGDVGDAEFVIENRCAGATRGLFGRFTDRLEILWQIKPLDVRIGDIAAQGCQPIIQRQLIIGIVGGRQAAVVARRQDVQGSVLQGSRRGPTWDVVVIIRASRHKEGDYQREAEQCSASCCAVIKTIRWH